MIIYVLLARLAFIWQPPSSSLWGPDGGEDADNRVCLAFAVGVVESKTLPPAGFGPQV